MNKLDLIATLMFLVYVGIAFLIYEHRVYQVYWWIRKNAPALYDEATRGTSHIPQLVIRNIKRNTSINNILPNRMYRSFQRSERHVTGILVVTIAAAVFIAAWRLCILF
ncbi:MAG: hypothetical protein A2010_09570 [Nitrospirae bacterium GWD2_57_9]|nr:MAG: hypothetical protein A2010_09570 [Nitrospirae bacterium GWD2_57_9]